MPIRIGAQFRPQHVDFDQMMRQWREADELGVDIIYTWDHFFPLFPVNEGKHYECIAILGAMAAVTERAEIGTLVVCSAYRNPELLAHAHQTVDHASGGRCVLGIGSGWFQKDFDEYGYEFGTAGSRLDALAQDLPRIEQRLSVIDPPPVRKIPVLIGGAGERKTLRLVAKHADRWHSFGDAEVFRAKDEILRRHCDEVGRDPGEIMRTWGAQSADIGIIESLAEAGIDEYVVGVDGDGHAFDLEPLRKVVAWRDAQR